MQPDFEPMRKQLEAWQQAQPSDLAPKIIIYQAFIERELDCALTPRDVPQFQSVGSS